MNSDNAQPRMMSRFQRYWEAAIPHCATEDCHLTNRIWRRVSSWHPGIRLWGRLFCGPQCFEKAARQAFEKLLANPMQSEPVRHRIPLGLLMLSRGHLTQSQLQFALEAQAHDQRFRLGEWFEKLGFATEQQVTSALGLQWACPVLPDGAARDLECTRLLPYRLLDTFHMLPLQFVQSTGMFYFAFSDGINYPAMYAVEQMLNCRTDGCLISHTAMKAALEEIGGHRERQDLLFEGWRDAAEMARISTGYITRLEIDEVRIISVGPYIWVRLQKRAEQANLLFRRPEVAAIENDGQILPMPQWAPAKVPRASADN